MVGSSSRGPQHESTQRIKPEIGAPGASVSAIAGTGTGDGPFGGTSGAAPMVTGSAALLLEGFGGVKTTAKGTASGKAIGLGADADRGQGAAHEQRRDRTSSSNPLTGALAEITRIGGGEVRAEPGARRTGRGVGRQCARRARSGSASWTSPSTVTLKKTVRIRNYDNTKRTYTITPTFRFANDAANGAVTVSAPSSVDGHAGSRSATRRSRSRSRSTARSCAANYMNSGSNGANPAALTLNEYDGYLVLDDGSDTLNIPWHVLPRKAAKVAPSTTRSRLGASRRSIGLNNQGVGHGAERRRTRSSRRARTSRAARWAARRRRRTSAAVGINTFPVPAGFCSANPSFIWAFAINTWERQEHLLPVSHQVYLDTEPGRRRRLRRRSTATRPALATITDGRQLAWVLNLDDRERLGVLLRRALDEHRQHGALHLRRADRHERGRPARTRTSTWTWSPRTSTTEARATSSRTSPSTPLGERFFGVPERRSGRTNDAARSRCTTSGRSRATRRSSA